MFKQFIEDVRVESTKVTAYIGSPGIQSSLCLRSMSVLDVSVKILDNIICTSFTTMSELALGYIEFHPSMIAK